MMEGSRCDEPDGCPDTLVRPVLEYDHQVGCAVIGGYRYRGALNALAGRYVYADYCSGWIFSAGVDAAGNWSGELLMQTRLNVSAFGESRDGELLLVDIGGGLFRLVGR